MSEFKKKDDKYRFWHSPIALVVLFFILALFSYNMFGLVEKERETSKKKELILSQIDADKKREAALSNDIEKLRTQEGIEETIRDKYQVVKPDEKMVVITDENTSKNSQNDESNIDHSFWGWIKRTFKF